MRSLTLNSALAATGIALAALATVPAQADITVKEYKGGSDTGSSITLGTLAATTTVPDGFFTSPVDTIANFDPYGNNDTANNPFTLEVSGSFTAPVGGLTITQGSDDGSYSYLDGSSTPFISLSGPKSFDTPVSATAAAGFHTFVIDYSESNGPPGTLQFTSPVPEASTTVSFGLLLTLGLGGVVLAARKKSVKA